MYASVEKATGWDNGWLANAGSVLIEQFSYNKKMHLKILFSNKATLLSRP